jgi:hypothetical protein
LEKFRAEEETPSARVPVQTPNRLGNGPHFANPPILRSSEPKA